MISVLFELEKVEFGIFMPGIPFPEKSQKECGLNCIVFSISVAVIWTFDKRFICKIKFITRTKKLIGKS